jgi:DNA-binding beta-propeller fold protein YncE
VLCAQEETLVFAAARGSGTLLTIDAASGASLTEVLVGPRPNGLAGDTRRKRVLVADAQDLRARIVDPLMGRVVAGDSLPGPPRWCAYDQSADRFLVNIREPACVAVLAADTLEEQVRWAVSSRGPHGLDLDRDGGRAFVASDGGMVSAVDLATGRELATVEIAREPDAIWYNHERDRLYVAIGTPGVIDVVDTGGMAIAERIPTEEGAHTTAFDRVRQRLYAFLPRSCRAAVYEEA